MCEGYHVLNTRSFFSTRKRKTSIFFIFRFICKLNSYQYNFDFVFCFIVFFRKSIFQFIIKKMRNDINKSPYRLLLPLSTNIENVKNTCSSLFGRNIIYNFMINHFLILIVSILFLRIFFCIRIVRNDIRSPATTRHEERDSVIILTQIISFSNVRLNSKFLFTSFFQFILFQILTFCFLLSLYDSFHIWDDATNMSWVISPMTADS